MFQVELQYDDIKGPTEIDMTRIPEFPASAALQSIEGQNLKGAAFDVLQAYADHGRSTSRRPWCLRRQSVEAVGVPYRTQCIILANDIATTAVVFVKGGHVGCVGCCL